MKKVTKILTLLLVAVMAISMVACGTYGKVKKAFEKEGYTESEALEGAASSIKSELGKTDEFAVNFHFFSKGLSFALVIEFQATDDMIEAYKNSDTLKGLVKDVTNNDDAKAFYKALCEAGYANGNCFVVPLSLNPTEIKDIVKKA